MRAQLKRLHSPDADLKSFHPAKEDDFSIFVQAMIGHEGSSTEESFGFVVCTPKWLDKHCCEAGKPIFGAGYIIVNEFRYDEVVSIIAALCRSIDGKSWGDLAGKLSRYGEWEFADYHPAA